MAGRARIQLFSTAGHGLFKIPVQMTIPRFRRPFPANNAATFLHPGMEN